MNLHARPLSVEEIEELAETFKRDLTSEMKRLMRRKSYDDAMHAMAAEDYIDKFVYTLKLRSGSQMHLPARARPIHIAHRKKGA